MDDCPFLQSLCRWLLTSVGDTEENYRATKANSSVAAHLVRNWHDSGPESFKRTVYNSPGDENELTAVAVMV